MKSTKLIFRKNYTRDTTLIIQQLWPLTMEKGISQLSIKSKFSPVTVDFINNGIIEIWENDRAINYIKKQLADVCQKKPQSALLLLKKYQRGLKEIAPIWKKGCLNGKKALMEFITKIGDLMVGDLFISYVGVDKRVGGKIKELAAKLREEDYFFVTNNQVISNTLIKLFPKLEYYINVLRIEDLNNPPSLTECRERFKNFINVSDGYSKIQTLKDYTKNEPFVFLEEKPELARGGIKGTAANLGRAVGRAKIVFSKRELDKVKKGDIIISPMTTADMMPALRRTAAIVTDEGGVICHAAIVARELNKPCLIATKAATKVFKDNDLVEVDVYERVVRKVKIAVRE